TACRLPLPFKSFVDTLLALQLTPFRGALANVGHPLTLVGGALTLVGEPLALVGDAVPLVRPLLVLLSARMAGPPTPHASLLSALCVFLPEKPLLRAPPTLPFPLH